MSEMRITRMVCGKYQENAYLVALEDRDDALLIDPGDDAGLILDTLKASGRRLTDILLTHGHFDHTLAVARVARETGAKVRMHPFDARMLTIESLSLYDPAATDTPFEPREPDFWFDVSDTAEAEFCGIPFTLIYCPGHTPGGMSFYSAEHGAVFTGDTLFEGAFGRTDLPGGSAKQLRRSLKKLLKLPPETIVHPGHGYSTLIERIVGGWE